MFHGFVEGEEIERMTLSFSQEHRNTGIEPLSHPLIAWLIHILEIIQFLEAERT